MKHISQTIVGALELASRTESHIEVKMLNHLMEEKRFVVVPYGQQPQGAGYFVFPQAEFGAYRADFLIKAVGYKSGSRVWPPNKELVICLECDGKEFHSSPEQKAYDKRRDDYFLKNGIKTYRYSGSEVHQFGRQIAKDIADILDSEIFRP